MDSKKVNIFTLILVIVMCAFSIAISTRNSSAKNGIDGKDGNDLTITSIYQDYKDENPNYTGSLADFISKYLGDIVDDLDDEMSKASLSAQGALCSTVDICFTYKMDNYYSLSLALDGMGKYIYKMTPTNQPYMNVSAGSGVIYKINNSGDTKTAYIITNYHVVYIESYSNESNSSVFYNSVTGEYITGTATDILYDNSFPKNQYVYPDNIIPAPTEAHFLDSYSIYLNGYQSKEYALSAEFVGGSAENDIAVLKIEYDSVNDANSNNKLIFNGNYAEASIADSDSISEADYVTAVGNPLIPNTNNINMSEISTYDQYLNAIEEAYISSLCLTTTGGRISQITCEMPFTSLLDNSQTIDMRLVQVDAAINPGNSGGGLYDISGKLVGIVNGKIADTSYDNVGFAIPINIASKIADQIISQCDNNEKINIYRLSVESLGLTLTEVAGETNQPTYNGKWSYAYDIVVDDISLISIANNYFEIGDIITSIKFAQETSSHNIVRAYQLDDLLLLARYPDEGEQTNIIFTVLRNGIETEVTIDFSSIDFIEIK